MKYTIILAALLTGCSATLRLPGMQDPQVEVVRALSAAQVASVKALTDALLKAQATACPVEVSK